VNDTALMEKRTANVSLKKIEDQQRLESHANKLREEDKKLAGERGAFRVDQRRKNRESEREWSAIQKEFGLKRRGQDLEFKNTRADRAIEKQKIAGQKIIARLYSSADKASAKAQVRVAKLQLEKGKISQKKYVEIVNIYKGLPDSGKPGKSKLQGWEKDKVNDAVYSLEQEKAQRDNRAKWIAKMQKAGLTRRLAVVAWNRYSKSLSGGDIYENHPR
jgi:hypothetical protein